MANDISIVIGAQDKASAVLKNVASQAGVLSSSFASALPAIAGIGTAIAGAVAGFAAIGGTIAGVVSAANSIDALSDKAAGLGESVGSLQEFQFALSEAGNISPDKAISVLEKLSATIGGIASGENKAGAEVLQQLGLDAAQLSLEGPIAQFEAIQQKLGEIDNLSERAATAQKIFGKAALELLPALTAQTESMRESAEYARKVGAAISDEGASAVAAMNDAVGRVSLGFQGLFNTIAIELAPAVETIALTIADWLPPLVEMAQSIIPAIVDGVAYLADSMLGVAEALGIITEREATWQEAIDKSRAAAAERAKEMEAMREAMRNAATPQGAVGADGKAVESTIAALERQLAVLQSSEEIVKQQEQLATARNQAEYERIEALQTLVMMEGALLDIQKQQAEEQKKRQEAAKKEAERVTRNATPDFAAQQAVQGRLLTRGTGGDVQTQILNVLKSALGIQQHGNRLLEQIYGEAKAKDIVLEKLVVP